jgi:hypothetical protein
MKLGALLKWGHFDKMRSIFNGGRGVVEGWHRKLF